jgi:lysophospholipase L1-like esterase
VTASGQGSAGQPLSRGKRWVFSLFLAFLLLAVLALAEVAARRLYPRIAPAAGRRAVASLLGADDAKRTGYFVQHPYLYYAYRPGFESFGKVQFNSHGHRGPERPVAKPPGVFRVLALGGSTTVSFPYVTDPASAWPAQLERRLAEKTGAPVEVINGGLHAATSAELLAHYSYRNRYFQPDVVILHVGGNDGLALHFPNYDPEYTHYTHGWRNTSLTPRPLEQTLLRSALVRTLYAHWLNTVSLEATVGRDTILSLTPEECLENVRATEPAGFRRNVELLVRNAAADGATPVLFPFVHAPEERMKKDRMFGAYTASMLLSYEKDYAVLRELARRDGLPLVELPEGTIPAADFKDFCHLNEDGERVKAAFVAEALVPLVRAWQQRAAGTR